MRKKFQLISNYFNEMVKFTYLKYELSKKKIQIKTPQLF